MTATTPIPQSKPAEAAFLGEIMTSTEFLESNLFRVTPDHFFSRQNRIIFEAIRTLKERDHHIDPMTVTDRLKEFNLLEEVGGPSYVSSCPFAPSGAVPERYFDILEEKLNLRKLLDLSQEVERWCFEGGESKEIIEKIGETVISFSKEDASGNMMAQTSDEVIAQIDRRIAGEKILGIQTGITPWDQMMGGINEQRFYVIAARGGRGKTAIIEQIIDFMLSKGIPVLMFQKDMSLTLFILRMACRRAGISFMKYDLGNCSTFELEQIKKQALILKESPMYLYSPSNMTAEKMCSIVKIEQRIHGIKVVFLDHVLNLDVGEDYRIGLTRASSRIRESIQQTKIPHVILAQLNRDGDRNERPTPSHIKEFDALYADCDHMIMLWSEKDAKDLAFGEALPVKFTVNKNRFGTEFEEEMMFDRTLMKFKTKL